MSLEAFLADPARPTSTLRYHEAQGFLFAVASSPQRYRAERAALNPVIARPSMLSDLDVGAKKSAPSMRLARSNIMAGTHKTGTHKNGESIDRLGGPRS
jgi:hypothetical protein